MALKCTYCKKGVGYGHAVSHAKNRTKRLFKPNLQKYRVLKEGRISLRVKLCTKCIKRLKKDGKLGIYFLKKPSFLISHIPPVPPEFPSETKVSKKVEKKLEKKKAEKKIPLKLKEKAVEKEEPVKKLDIESIVGKKS